MHTSEMEPLKMLAIQNILGNEHAHLRPVFKFLFSLIIDTIKYLLNPEAAQCTVPFSLFADPERILRRLYVFAEEPCKSNTTTSEPCSPVFKEAQPRPSDSLNLKYHINNLNLYLYVFGLKLFIIVIKSIQPDCDKNQRN